eukprot:g8000.t1 g8000   contig26:769027-769882(-)
MVTSTNEAPPPLPPLPPPLPPINVNPSSNGKQSKHSPNKKSSNSKSNHSPTSASANTSSDLSIQQQRNHIWHARYDELKHFKTIKGHCNVPQRDTEFGALGGWVASQRSEHRKLQANKSSSLTPERLQLLTSLGFRFRLKASNRGNWVDRFEELKQYKEREGHVDVPQRKGALGIWVVTQRKDYKKRKAGKQSPLDDNRIQLLEGLGFKWRMK